MKKSKTIYIIAGIAALGAAGYFAYAKGLFSKKEITPEPSPEPEPSPAEKKVITTTIPAKKIADLQNAMVQYFGGKTINNASYTTADAAGGWGSKSRTALAAIFPSTYAGSGDITANNIDAYIKLTKDGLASAAANKAAQKTAQDTQSAAQALASRLVDGINKGLKAELLNTITINKHIFDNLSNSYKMLNDKETFRKGVPFTNIVNRKNGQVMLKVNDLFDGKTYYYPTSPSNFILIQ